MTVFLNSLVDLGLPVVGAAKASTAITLRPAATVGGASPPAATAATAAATAAPVTAKTAAPAAAPPPAAAAAPTTGTAATVVKTSAAPAAPSSTPQMQGDDSIEGVQAAMTAKAQELGLRSACFKAVDPCYYDQELEWRRDTLGASSVDELCKSVIMENTKLAPDAEPGRVRVVLVLVQYIAKLNKERLIKAVQAIEASRNLPALGKKQYNMRLLEGETCAKMTGFEHNAVTPLGLDIPIVLSDKIAELPSGHFWLGGGHIDLKLRLDVKEVTDKLKAVVADVTG